MTPSSSLVRTRAFQALDTGSNPVGVAIDLFVLPDFPMAEGRNGSDNYGRICYYQRESHFAR